MALQSNDAHKNRALSWLIAALLSISLVSFIGGYFLGIRQGARAFICAQQEELAESMGNDNDAVSAPAVELNPLPDPVPLPSAEQTVSVPATSYWAVAATVDSYVFATHLMEQAAALKIVVRIKKTVNLLPHGRKKVVYQLVTPRYTTKEQLETALARLKRLSSWSKFLNATINKD